jgi:nitrous oxide reductase accessory protein NosL
MLISERSYAAAMRRADGHDELFDDIGCLVAAVRARPADDAHYWFHDAGDGDWITGVSPVFMVSARLRTPMGGGIAAYRDRAEAEREAARHAGRVIVAFSDLTAPAGSSR